MPAADLDISIDPSASLGKKGEIIIIYPGRNGSQLGFNGKYSKIAVFLQERLGAAILRAGNLYFPGSDFLETSQENLRSVTRYALKNSLKICGTANPNIYIMGVSMGAWSCAMTAHEFPEIQKILLIAPSYRAQPEKLEKCLGEFKGEVYVVGAAHDKIVGEEAAEHVFRHAKTRATKELIIIPDCDHQFTGKENGKIFSTLPLWAFGNNLPVPSAADGIELY